MALFKVFKGPQNRLEEVPIHEGYAYFTEDGHNLYIDISNTQRVQVNAKYASGLSDGIDTIEIDEVLTTSDIIGVENGGTGLNKLTLNAVLVGNGTNSVKLIPVTVGAFFGENDISAPKFGTLPLIAGGTGGTTAQQARGNLSVYSKNETDEEIVKAKTVAYTATLSPNSWVASGNSFYQDWNNVQLSCGVNGNTPPLITYTSNRDEYSKLDADRTVATAGSGIRFYTSEVPTNAIDLIIIDLK